MKKIVFAFLFLNIISCTNNSNTILSDTVGDEIQTIELIQLLHKTQIKSKDKFVKEVKFNFDADKSICKIISVKDKNPEVFIFENESTKKKIDCYNSKNKSEWVKVCSDDEKCTKYFCNCILKTGESTNYLIYSPRSKTIYLKV